VAEYIFLLNFYITKEDKDILPTLNPFPK